jgi:transcriptional regulator with XRE-family HTH domain
VANLETAQKIWYNGGMNAVLTKNEALVTVADNVRHAMAKTGIGVNELARIADVHPMTVSRLINRHGMPVADALARIADALSVRLDLLFEPVDDEA